MTILGLDIGGANLKAADESGVALTRPFAIWRNRDALKSEIAAILARFPQTDQIALTMTAELADCFSTKAEGVDFILNAADACDFQQMTDEVVKTSWQPRIIVWSTDGRFLRSREARGSVQKVAAANWHALATWSTRLAPMGPSLLVDIGTTTTDIIPLVDGKPVPNGLTDVTRLQSGELSYSGIWRTPLFALAHSVPFRDGYCSLAAEVFATTVDVYLLLNRIDEDASNCETADGRLATKAAAHDRIARMLCCDREEVDFDEAVQIARFLADVQRQRLAGALERVASRQADDIRTVILAGSGSFLARQLVLGNRRTSASRLIPLADELSPQIADAACAYAVQQLALADRKAAKSVYT